MLMVVKWWDLDKLKIFSKILNAEMILILLVA